MAQTQTSSFTVADWDEQEIAGAAHAMRHTVTHYAASYFGEVSGTSTFDLVMVYRPDGTVPYTGYEFFEGTIGQRSGTVVFEHRGVYEGDGASSELSVVPGTATGVAGGRDDHWSLVRAVRRRRHADGRGPRRRGVSRPLGSCHFDRSGDSRAVEKSRHVCHVDVHGAIFPFRTVRVLQSK